MTAASHLQFKSVHILMYLSIFRLFTHPRYLGNRINPSCFILKHTQGIRDYFETIIANLNPVDFSETLGKLRRHGESTYFHPLGSKRASVCSQNLICSRYPIMSIRHAENEFHIRVRRPKGTECTRSGRVRIGEVATCKSDVGVHVGATTHPRRWVNHHKLCGCTGEQLIAESWWVQTRQPFIGRKGCGKEAHFHPRDPR